jgi:NADH-quinone oxidoreductase subunit I
MKRAFLEVCSGFGSLLTGMRITLQQFFKPSVTVQYPHQTLKMPKRYRGHITLVRDPETGKALCIACKSCEKACPSDCIVVDGVKREGEKKKSVSDFKLNFTTCSLCGSCVEVCPIEALQFSREYNLASTSKERFFEIDLYKDGAPTEQPKPAPLAAPEPATPTPSPEPVVAAAVELKAPWTFPPQTTFCWPFSPWRWVQP